MTTLRAVLRYIENAPLRELQQLKEPLQAAIAAASDEEKRLAEFNRKVAALADEFNVPAPKVGPQRKLAKKRAIRKPYLCPWQMDQLYSLKKHGEPPWFKDIIEHDASKAPRAKKPWPKDKENYHYTRLVETCLAVGYPLSGNPREIYASLLAREEAERG